MCKPPLSIKYVTKSVLRMRINTTLIYSMCLFSSGPAQLLSFRSTVSKSRETAAPQLAAPLSVVLWSKIVPLPRKEISYDVIFIFFKKCHNNSEANLKIEKTNVFTAAAWLWCGRLELFCLGRNSDKQRAPSYQSHSVLRYLEVSSGGEHRLDSSHPVVVVMLGGELLWAQSIGGHNFHRQRARRHKATRVEDDLCDHCVVWYHHSHSPEQSLL